MKFRLRAGMAAAAVLIASYGIVAASNQNVAADVRGADETETTTDTRTNLPDQTPSDVLVDDANQQVFVSLPSQDAVVVTDLNGEIKKTIIGGLRAPREMALSADGSTVHLVAGGIAHIDTSTYEITHTPVPDGCHPGSATFTGGRVWFSHMACQTNPNGIASIDPTTGEVSMAMIETPAEHQILRASPDRPDRLAVVQENGFVGIYDVTSGTPKPVAERPAPEASPYCVDAALLPKADQIALACTGYQAARILNASDLSHAAWIDAPDGYGWPNAVAVTPDGRHLALGLRERYYAELHVFDIQQGVPGTAIHPYSLGNPNESMLADDALAFSTTGRLFAVERKLAPYHVDAVLHGLGEATKVLTKMWLNTPTGVDNGVVTGVGSLRPAGAAPVVRLMRKDSEGEHDLGEISVGDDGTFTFTDRPETIGPVTYTVSYPGDDSHMAAKATQSTVVRLAPQDVNGDGYADTIVGVPGEDLGSFKNAGMFQLLYGSATGTTGSGSKAYHQDTAGVPGAAESGDRFGYSHASGDFNGDGYADVAVSSGAENLGSVVDAGSVTVFYGSARGLRLDDVGTITLNHTPVAVTRAARFGDALAAGDFNGDGRDDLAIGAAGAGGGHFFVSTGTANGLSRNLTDFSQDGESVPGESNAGDQFGRSLAAGDVNADGRDDLAVGTPHDAEVRGWSTGTVTTFHGGSNGLSSSSAYRWSKILSGVPGDTGTFDRDAGDEPDQFGDQVALEDFNGDGRADLAASAPGAPVTGTDGRRKADAGTVTVLYSAGSRIWTTGAVEVTQKTSGMPGSPGANDFFGHTLTAGDASGDGAAELAIYSPGDTYVTVVPGASGGLAYGAAKGWTQNSAGIPGSTESGDEWGDSLRFADVQGTGHHALIVGAPGENSGEGAITVIYSTTTGLTGTGATYFSQNSSGISGTAESGDAFGTFR